MRLSSYFYIFNRIFQLIGFAFTIKIITAQLDPTELAKFNIIMIFIGLFTLIFVNPVGFYINRRQHEWSEAGLIRSRILNAFVFYLIAAIISTLIIHYFFQSIQNNFSLSNNWLVICIISSLIINSMGQTLANYFNLQGYYITWAIVTQLILWTGIIAAYWLTSLTSSAIYWFMGILCGQFIGLVVAFIPFLIYTQPITKAPQLIVKRDSLSEMLNFIIPAAIAIGLAWLQYQSYRLFIGYSVSLHYLGLFIAGYSISSGIFQAYEVTIQQYTYPTFYQQISGKQYSDIIRIWNDYYLTITPTIIISMTLIILMANPLLHFFVDSKYWAAGQFVMLGAIVEALRVTGNVYVLATQALMKTKKAILPQLLGALVVLIFVPLSLYFKEPQLLSASLILAGLSYVAAMHLYLQKTLNTKLEILHKKKIIGAALAFTLISIITQHFNDSTLNNFIGLAFCGSTYLIVNYLIIRRTIWFTRQTP